MLDMRRRIAMNCFDSGITEYVKATATVEVYFPVDQKGHADVRCVQCEYFRRSTNRCGLNDRLCAYPDKYVGQFCPLSAEENTSIKGEIIK